MSRKRRSGFTIVELLIVIIVIAILAAISIVAYRGIQQRATNTSIINAASSSLRLMQAYIATNGTYPISSNSSVCVTTTTGCVGDQGGAVNGSSLFDTAMASLGNLPRDIPVASADRKGIYFFYNTGITVDGAYKPMMLAYWLSGDAQNCGLSNVVLYQWPTISSSTLGYSSTSSGRTMCWISVSGPNT